MGRAFIATALAGALVVAAFAVPAGAGERFSNFQVTLSGDGDPDGSGTASLQIDPKTEVVCFQIHVENVSTPITGGAITVGESGTIVSRLIIRDPDQDIDDCTGQLGIRRQEMNRIVKDPGSHFLHLYNDEHPCDPFASRQCPPGAVQGQLQGVS
jgi:hypothetical protein